MVYDILVTRRDRPFRAELGTLAVIPMLPK